jgi:hypothetical protein
MMLTDTPPSPKSLQPAINIRRPTLPELRIDTNFDDDDDDDDDERIDDNGSPCYSRSIDCIA